MKKITYKKGNIIGEIIFYDEPAIPKYGWKNIKVMQKTYVDLLKKQTRAIKMLKTLKFDYQFN